MSWQYGELRPTNGWDRLTSLGHPCKFQVVLRLGSVTARHLVVGVSQTLRCWTEVATYIRQGDYDVGLWPTFLVNIFVKLVTHNSICHCQPGSVWFTRLHSGWEHLSGTTKKCILRVVVGCRWYYMMKSASQIDDVENETGVEWSE